MTGLSSSAANPVSLPAKVAAPSVNAPGGQSLAAFTDMMADKVDAQAREDASADDERQDDAAPGKSLPDKDKDTVDPALAWLLGTAPIVPPKPVTVALPVAPVAVTPVVIDPATLLDAVAAVPAAPLPPVAPTSQPATDFVLPGDDGVPAAPIDLPMPAATKSTPQPAKIALPPAVQPLAATIAANAPMPALFALALGADRGGGNDDAAAPSLTPTAATLLQPSDAAALIAKPGGAKGQALDMGRQDWPQKMIDHIEALRDGANANDTSIRLKPEALGRVDIALRTHTDGAISVRFTAEQPNTRTMLVDATPQLSAAAEARGIRLAGTSVDLSGSDADDNRQWAQTARSPTITNTLAGDGEPNETVSDGRIA
ncbi:MAG: flagellar hook-length control protein FliK [Pseudomonadota bacterium]